MSSQSHYRGTISPTTVIRNPPQGNENGSITIKPKALDIVWGADPRYWRVPTSDNDTAELLQVSWVEVSGSVDLSDLPEGNYRLFFRLTLQSDAFGWQGSPVYFMVKVGQGRQKWKKFDLGNFKPTSNSPAEIPGDLKFKVEGRTQGEKLRFGLYEIWRGRWKGGLVIHDVVIKPDV